MILNSIKFGGNRTKDLEVGPDKQTDGQTDRPIPTYTPPHKKKLRLQGGININNFNFL